MEPEIPSPTTHSHRLGGLWWRKKPWVKEWDKTTNPLTGAGFLPSTVVVVVAAFVADWEHAFSVDAPVMSQSFPASGLPLG